MSSLWAGYHIMEKQLVRVLNVTIKHISIVEFFRKISGGIPSGAFIVHGLDETAKIWDSPEKFALHLRRKLRTIVEQMIQGSCIVIFAVEDDKIVGEERPFLLESKLNLSKIFGADRLERISKGHFYSTPNIP